MGEFLKIVPPEEPHACTQPPAHKWGEGTRWQCECGKTWRRVWGSYTGWVQETRFTRWWRNRHT